ncbi:hypothetical protein VAE151_620070 [Vibrio aestuarianus]|nr:hypothetical protein VIBAE_B10083 [Vibrio aestuarianus subsp. francensis]CAH8218558.1 hypothetical protein VAE055_410083 [Vibrio aestuarianus]CAH8218749.1 hypothetical protein VAE032_310085 [Vibrio aestuarianus]CAH8218861.1 hypothetical protein VAE128_490085 [Vibrio aestuarianus]CAH8219090.1 hypothetical protein VAE130_590086 [Vibrio aestuarianus]
MIHNAWRPHFKPVQCLWHNALGKVGGVVHTLIWRYVYLYFNGLNVLGSSPLSLWQFVPSRLSKSALLA